MIINVHAGHNPDGKVACGAVGVIKESTEARKVKDEVIRLLKAAGHTVYDCTVNDGTSANDVLVKIVKKCNAHKADLDVSIHFNSGANDRAGNGRTTGTEVYLYNSSSKAKKYAEAVVKQIAALGFTNRGVKVNPKLYFLRRSNNPAMLIECCFVDDKDDARLYNYKRMAEAIVCGITGQAATATKTEYKAGNWYRVKEPVPVCNGYYGEHGKYIYLSNQIKTSCDNKSGIGYLRKGADIKPVDVRKFDDGSVWFKLDATIACLAVGVDGKVYIG